MIGEVDSRTNRVSTLPVLAGWLFTAAFLPVFMVLAHLSRPIADDYKYFARARDFGVLGGISEHLNAEQGRYTSALIVNLGYRFFGLHSVQVLAVCFVTLLVFALTLTAWRFLPLGKNHRWRDATLIGAVTAVVIILSAPSLFDSYFWLTSAVNYAPSFAILLLNLVLADVLLRGLEKRRWRLNLALSASLTVLTFAGQGLNEVLSVLVVGTVAVALLVVLLRRNWRAMLALLGPGLAAVGGLAITFFAPGAAVRRDVLGTGLNFRRGFNAMELGWQYLTEQVGLGKLFLILTVVALLVGVLCSRSRLRPRQQDSWRLCVIGAVFIAVSPCQIWATGLIGAFSARTMTVPLACVVVGLGCLGAGVIPVILNPGGTENDQKTKESLRKPRTKLKVGIACAVAASALLGGLASATDVMRLIKAESLRASAVAQRETSIKLQLQEGYSYLTILPAPLLYEPNEGKDFPYNLNPSSTVMRSGYIRYYHLPKTTEFIIEIEQPKTYCVSWPTPAYYRAKTCEELALAETG